MDVSSLCLLRLLGPFEVLFRIVQSAFLIMNFLFEVSLESNVLMSLFKTNFKVTKMEIQRIYCS